MALETEQIKLDLLQFSGTAQMQTVVEGDIALPGMGEDGIVLSSCGHVKLNSFDCLTDRIQVTGEVLYSLIYIDAQKQAARVEAASPFSVPFGFAGIRPQAVTYMQGNCQQVEVQVLRGRVLVRGIVQLDAVAFLPNSYQAISSVQGEMPIHSKEGIINSFTLTMKPEEKSFLTGESNLSDCVRILRIESTALPVQTQLSQGNGQVTGEVCSTFLWQDGAGGLHSFSQTLPYSLTLPMPDTQQEDTLYAFMHCEDTIYTLSEDILQWKVLLVCQSFVGQERENTLLLDAFATQGNILEPTYIQAVGLYPNLYTNAYVTIQYPFHPVNGEVLGEVFPGEIKILSLQENTEENTLDLVLETGIYQQTEEGEISFFSQEMPIHTSVPFTLDSQRILALSFASPDLIRKENQIEVTVDLHMQLLSFTERENHFVEEISLSDEMVEDMRGLCVFFAGEEDTLFSVGKRFGLTQEEILKVNPQIREPIKGKQIILYKQKAQ